MGRNNADFNNGVQEGPHQIVAWTGESGDSYSMPVKPGMSKKDAGRSIGFLSSIDRSYKEAGVHGQTVEEPVKGSVRWNKNE